LPRTIEYIIQGAAAAGKRSSQPSGIEWHGLSLSVLNSSLGNLLCITHLAKVCIDS
jgi:hypothetical protein